jgi:ABC-type multidrug transport system fused ATPase/permease subunit
LLILWYVIGRIKNENIKVSDLIMIAAFTNAFYYQFFELVYRLRNLAKRYVDIERYFGLLDEEILVNEPENPAQIKKILGNVNFEHVSFYYPDSKDKQSVVKDINLQVKPGEWVAFVGLSGAGKTTIIKLLLRFFDPISGKITIDGINLKDFTKKQLRSFIGVVPQEPILFNDTIKFNLAYGKPKASWDEIDRAAKMANIYDFIQSLPDKYKTKVGERGIKLSGGQKQRLAIARALLTKPSIIVFDEATSNLDSESERLIQKSLWNIAKSRTLFIIAHRLSTLKRVNRIIVMNCGLITDQGSHQELIEKKKGIYHYLWQLQTKAQKRSIRIKS